MDTNRETQLRQLLTDDPDVLDRCQENIQQKIKAMTDYAYSYVMSVESYNCGYSRKGDRECEEDRKIVEKIIMDYCKDE